MVNGMGWLSTKRTCQRAASFLRSEDTTNADGVGGCRKREASCGCGHVWFVVLVNRILLPSCLMPIHACARLAGPFFREFISLSKGLRDRLTG